MTRNFKVETGIEINGDIDLKELQSIPSNPHGGHYKVYVKNGKLYILDENGESEEIGSGGSGEMSMNQVTKLGVVAPKTVDIDIPYTAQFNLPSVEVLKFTAGAENQVVTLVEFDNGDSTDFEPNEFVEFDGTMSIKTEYSYDMAKDTNIDEGFLSVVEFDKSKFKEIASLEVSEKVAEQTMNEKILDMIKNR